MTGLVALITLTMMVARTVVPDGGTLPGGAKLPVCNEGSLPLFELDTPRNGWTLYEGQRTVVILTRGGLLGDRSLYQYLTLLPNGDARATPLRLPLHPIAIDANPGADAGLLATSDATLTPGRYSVTIHFAQGSTPTPCHPEHVYPLGSFTVTVARTS